MTAATKMIHNGSIGFLLITLSFSSLFSMAGCQSPTNAENNRLDDESYSIHVDRRNNGAAVTLHPDQQDQNTTPSRTLIFEVDGSASPASATSTSTTQDRRAAELQAAIINAFGKALIEARRLRGQSDHDFTAKLSPRLTVEHQTIGDGYQVEVHLLANGVENVFSMRNGVLLHPPHDFGLIRKLFDETNGEFSLLSTNRSAITGAYTARVACYTPIGLQAARAEDITEDEVRSEIP